jgi:hypothetical protein
MGTMARTAVIAGTATAVSGSMRASQANNAQQAQAGSAAQQELDAIHQQQMIDQAVAQATAQQAAQQQAFQEPPAPAAVPIEDKISKIKELGELKAAGLLTEEEFAAEKAKVLAG